MALHFHVYSVFLSAVTCSLSQLSCVIEWFHLSVEHWFVGFFPEPINRNKTPADFRLDFVDDLIYRIKIPSRMQISDQML